MIRGGGRRASADSAEVSEGEDGGMRGSAGEVAVGGAHALGAVVHGGELEEGNIAMLDACINGIVLAAAVVLSLVLVMHGLCVCGLDLGLVALSSSRQGSSRSDACTRGSSRKRSGGLVGRRGGGVIGRHGLVCSRYGVCVVEESRGVSEVGGDASAGNGVSSLECLCDSLYGGGIVGVDDGHDTDVLVILEGA